MNTLLIDGYISQINGRLSEQGYSHRIKCYRNGNRIQIWWGDITAGQDYHSREFGNLTQIKAERLLEGIWFGLQVGLLNAPIE